MILSLYGQLDDILGRASLAIILGQTGDAHSYGKAAEQLIQKLLRSSRHFASERTMRFELMTSLLLAHTYRDYPAAAYPMFYIERARLLGNQVGHGWQRSLLPYIAMEEAQAAIAINDVERLSQIVLASSELATRDATPIDRVRYLARIADLMTLRGDNIGVEHVMRRHVIPGSIDTERPDLTAGHYQKHAQSLLALGDPDGAWRSLERAEDILKEHDSVYFRLRLATIRGEVAISVGDIGQATLCYEESERLRLLAQVDVKRNMELRERLRNLGH